MERLGTKKVRTLLEFISNCYCSGDVENFKQRGISRLAKVVQSNVRRYNELGPPRIRKYRANGVHRRCTGSEAAPFARDIPKNPACSHHQKIPGFLTSTLLNLTAGSTRRCLRNHAAQQPSKNPKAEPPNELFEKRNELFVERLTGLLQSRRNTQTETRMQQKAIILKHALNTLNLGWSFQQRM